MSRLLVLGLLAAFAVRPASARAETEDPEDKPQPPKRAPLALDAWGGVGIDHTGLGVGMTLLVRPSWLTLGIGGEIARHNSDESYDSVDVHEQRASVLAGTTVAPTHRFALDVLAEVGVNDLEVSRSWTESWSGGLLGPFRKSRIATSDPSVLLPYAGIRLGPMFAFGKPGRPKFLLGSWFILRQNLSSRVLSYTVETCETEVGLFGPDRTSCSDRQGSTQTGGLRLLAGVRLGAALPFP